jgi:hypothetical protein
LFVITKGFSVVREASLPITCLLVLDVLFGIRLNFEVIQAIVGAIFCLNLHLFLASKLKLSWDPRLILRISIPKVGIAFIITLIIEFGLNPGLIPRTVVSIATLTCEVELTSKSGVNSGFVLGIGVTITGLL